MIRRIHPQVVAAPINFKSSAVCEAYSANPFDLYWIRINNDNFTNQVTISNRENFVDTEYRWASYISFDNLTVTDAGRYLCVAENIAGRVSREISVHIQGIQILSRDILPTLLGIIIGHVLVTCW